MSQGSRGAADERYLRAFVAHADPVLTSTEVAEELDVSQQAAYKKLEQLVDRDLLRAKKVGSRGKVYWITTDGRDAYRESSS